MRLQPKQRVATPSNMQVNQSSLTQRFIRSGFLSFARSKRWRVTRPIRLPLTAAPPRSACSTATRRAVAYRRPGQWRLGRHLRSPPSTSGLRTSRFRGQRSVANGTLSASSKPLNQSQRVTAQGRLKPLHHAPFRDPAQSRVRRPPDQHAPESFRD